MPKKQLAIEEKMNNALVPENEWPYKLPDNWCWVKLDSVSNFERGITFPASAKEYELSDNNIPCIRTANIQEDFDISNLIYVDKKYIKNNKEKMTRVNDIIMSSANSRELVGKVSYIFSLPFEMTFGGFVITIRSKRCVLSKYLYYHLKKDFLLGKYLNESTQTTNLANINTAKMSKWNFPLAPLLEQHRIVSRIESLFAKLDEAKGKIQNILDGADSRKAAILHQAFTGKLTAKWRKENKYSSQEFFCKIRNYLSEHKKKKVKIKDNLQFNSVSKMIPKDWILVNLDSISERITDGEHKTPRRVDSYCGYYLLSARNVHDDTLNLDNVDFIDSIEYGVISKRCNPKKDDILLSCSGSVGRCCVISDENKYCMVRSVAVISQPSCNSRFIMYMIQSEIVQEQIHKMSKQTAQANLFLGAIASLAIPLPSREEQDYIVDILDDKFAKEKSIFESCEVSLATIETMKKAILAKAFRGELGTNNPAEESSKELLREIISI